MEILKEKICIGKIRRFSVCSFAIYSQQFTDQKNKVRGQKYCYDALISITFVLCQLGIIGCFFYSLPSWHFFKASKQIKLQWKSENVKGASGVLYQILTVRKQDKRRSHKELMMAFTLQHTGVTMLLSHHFVVLLNFSNITFLGTVHSLKFFGLVTYFSFYIQLFTQAAKITCELSRK